MWWDSRSLTITRRSDFAGGTRGLRETSAGQTDVWGFGLAAFDAQPSLQGSSWNGARGKVMPRRVLGDQGLVGGPKAVWVDELN